MKLCELCATRPAMKDDILCQECSERYSTLLKSAMDRTSKVNLLSAKYGGEVLPVVSESINRKVQQPDIDQVSTMSRTTPSTSEQESMTQLLQEPSTQSSRSKGLDEAGLLERLQELKEKNESLRKELQRSKGLRSGVISYLLMLIG